MPPAHWIPKLLHDFSRHVESTSPRAILRWSCETFAPHLAMATGFGPSGVVLMHMLSQIHPETTVFYLDTDLLFEETYALRDQLAEQFGLTFTRVHSGLSLEAQADEHGPALWTREPDRCCALRKVRPLRQFLATRQAWITGIRRDQSPTRADIRPVEWDDANGLVKINPLAGWSAEDVWAYIDAYDLPYNPLHDDGYPSLGCLPCTRRVAAGEDDRAGRWSGFTKTECGIHLTAASDDRPS